MSSIYSQLLAALDQQFIFKNSVSSSVKRLDVYHDYKTQENVVLLEYRVKVNDDLDDDDDRWSRRDDIDAIQDEQRRQEMKEEMEGDYRDGNYMAEIKAMIEANPSLGNMVL